MQYSLASVVVASSNCIRQTQKKFFLYDWLLLLLQAGRSGPDPAVLHTLRSCELLECLTNGQLIMLTELLQPVSMLLLSPAYLACVFLLHTL
jgi:hypothetical protein